MPHLHELVHIAGSRAMAQLLCMLCWTFCWCVSFRVDLTSQRMMVLMEVAGSSVWVSVWCTWVAPAVGISTMSRSWVALAAQLLLATASVLHAKNSRLALSTSWGCLRCMHLALHGGLPRDLTSLALEAGVLLGCLGCLHCMQRLLETLAVALRRHVPRRGNVHGYGRGYGCVTP